jgi:hypothetical protein
MVKRLAAAVGIGILLGACSAASTGTSQKVSAASSVTAAQLVGVAKEIFPFAPQYGVYVVCGVNGDLSKCPVTSRLKARLTQAKITLCQCQNPAASIEITAAPTNNGGIAHVSLGSSPSQIELDLVIIQVDGKLLVDDELCMGGDASTSIYARGGGCGSDLGD